MLTAVGRAASASGKVHKKNLAGSHHSSGNSCHAKNSSACPGGLYGLNSFISALGTAEFHDSFLLIVGNKRRGGVQTATASTILCKVLLNWH